MGAANPPHRNHGVGNAAANVYEKELSVWA